MLEAVEKAERTVAFETFVYWTGDIADRFASTLAEAASRGAEVRVLLDAYGARPMDQRLCRTMSESGCRIRWFRPLKTPKLWNVDNRTHRKIMVVDDRVGFTGGVGIAREWEGDARSPDEWRETHLRLEGPAVLPLQAAFYDNWNEAGPWEPHSPREDSLTEPGDVPVMVFRSSSTIGWTDMATLFRTMVYCAEREIRLVSGYFVPDPPLIDLLKRAAGRGVDVRILIPGPHTDTRLSQLAGSVGVGELLRAGVRIWKYQKTMLHAKLAMVDADVAFVGSPNLNRRSMGKDEECGVVALTRELTARLRDDFDDDCANARELEAGQWSSRGRWRRTKERAAHLIMNQL